MPADQLVSQGHGVVVLAAYRPDPGLFATQLRSIRDQTRHDFRVLIGADGGQEVVRSLVADIVGDDPRFEVIGWDDNLGFYLNFERLLMAVPTDAAWVALSDQDDRWYPDKLERLVPSLDSAALATGQARVVTWPEGRVLLERTDRHVVAAEDLLFQNQVSGALSVFRRQLLDTALPFPQLNAITQLHDHWLALCAITVDRFVVLDAVVQDYVQHDSNQVGEVEVSCPGWTARRVVERWRELADTYEGGHSPLAVFRVSQRLSFGWRRLMLETLSERVDGYGRLPRPALHMAERTRRGSLKAVVQAVRSNDVAPSVVATFVAGLPGELISPAPRDPTTGGRAPDSSRVVP